ncbi:MAG: SIS domain-containing protein [Comamonas sp.]|jgi:D-sedoheptulose 7-phosphate isomerase|uniref:SIS domain-containing protein n=1 Tax=Comamonas sp. TaxID=34028 RepID=UPI003D09BC4E
MLEQHIQQHFIDSADLHYQVSQEMSESVASAVYALLACVTSGNKVMCCGNGLSWAQAAQFAAMCVSGMERERPELAAMVLDNGALAQAQLGSSLTAEGHTQTLARQVRTLGQPGDLLLVISADGHDRALLGAVEAAHERDMSAVVLTGRTGGLLANALSETDVLMRVPHDRSTRVREVHQLVLHCLVDGIDTQLLGEEE